MRMFFRLEVTSYILNDGMISAAAHSEDCLKTLELLYCKVSAGDNQPDRALSPEP